MANTPRFCPRCGLPVEEGVRTCQGCGEKLPIFRSAAREPETAPVRPKMDWRPFLIGLGTLAGIGFVFVACTILVIVIRLNGMELPLLGIRQETPRAAATFTLAPATAQPTALVPITAASLQPSPTFAQPAFPEPNLIYQGIRLFYDPALATGYKGKTIPAATAEQGAPWDVAPEHLQVDFQGYILPETFHTPSLYVYPAKEYAKASEQAAASIAALQKLLKEKPASAKDLPFLPAWNAGPLMNARLDYLDFQNGSGVRYLSQHAQAIYPINNRDLFYTFQGLTSDGKYYVAFVLPASHPALPATGDLNSSQYDALQQDYPNYVKSVVNTLESQPPESFKPGLDMLDQMVRSLEVGEK